MRELFFLIDGHALTYRAYYGMRKGGKNLTTRTGIPTDAVFGFTRILMELIKRYRPHLLAVGFDRPEDTHRKEGYEAYKANRQPPPEDLILQFPLVQKVVQAFGIPIYEQAGYEADDIIGTLATRAAAADYDVRIVTGDRDLFQLVNDRIKVLMPGDRGEFKEYDADGVLAKCGFRPEQVTDYKALAGDSSDNIPGVRGIGDKTAIKLLQTWGSLDNLYAHLPEVELKYRKKLEEDADNAKMSHKLATIMTDMDIPFDAERCALTQPSANLKTVLQEFEFNSIIAELPQTLLCFQPLEIPILPEHQVQVIRQPNPLIPTTLTEVEPLLTKWRQSPFALDLETTSLNALQANLVGIAIATPNPENTAIEAADCVYLPVGHQPTLDEPVGLPLAETLALLKPLLEDPSCPKYGHNLKYDMNVLSRYDIHVQGVCDDTMVLDYVLHPEGKHGLKDLALNLLHYPMQPIVDLIGSGKKLRTMDQVAAKDSARYAGADVAATQALRDYLLKELAQTSPATQFLYQEIEAPLVPVLTRMEQNGITLDTALLSNLSHRLAEDLAKLETEVYAMVGEPFNLKSPQQMAEVLFHKLNLPTKGLKKTTTGYSTDVSTLEKLKGSHPIIDKILDYRQWAKLKDTYTDALPQLVHPLTGRLHTTFNQTGTATGRLSSVDPNLQNIPIKTELGREIRHAFVAPGPDWVIASLDYSQIELRLLAHFSDDPRFLEAFRQDGDIHSQTAVEIFNLGDIRMVTSEMRRIAKTTNFGIVYGQTAYGLANTLGIPNREADQLIQRFKQRYNGIEAYMAAMLAQAREKGYVETLFGRRRYLPDILHPTRNLREFAERIAINTPLQGTAADLIKLAMVRVDQWLQSSKSPTKMLLQVHDELVFEIPKAELATTLPQLQQLMENIAPLKVPLRVDVSTGSTWREAKG